MTGVTISIDLRFGLILPERWREQFVGRPPNHSGHNFFRAWREKEFLNLPFDIDPKPLHPLPPRSCSKHLKPPASPPGTVGQAIVHFFVNSRFIVALLRRSHLAPVTSDDRERDCAQPRARSPSRIHGRPSAGARGPGRAP